MIAIGVCPPSVSMILSERNYFWLNWFLKRKPLKMKKTWATDLRQNTEAWKRVARKYVSERCTPCTTKQLKKCWDNMKQRKRKINTAQRHQRLMIGGGPALVESTDSAMDFIDVNPNVDAELYYPFDSTATFEKERSTGHHKGQNHAAGGKTRPAHRRTYQRRRGPYQLHERTEARDGPRGPMDRALAIVMGSILDRYERGGNENRRQNRKHRR